MKTIIKLTNEYASNLNALFINVSSKTAAYYDLFSYIFKDCTLVKLSSVIVDTNCVDLQNIDIVIINIADDQGIKVPQDIKNATKILRHYNELMPIFVIKDDLEQEATIKSIDQCYCLDGAFPFPFDRDPLYGLLYRQLKRITVAKDLAEYTDSLEKQLFNNPAVEKNRVENITVEIEHVKKPTVLIDIEREKSLRYSPIEKISAQDYTETLDDSIIDKMEVLSENLDAFISVLYDFEDSLNPDEVHIMIKNITKNIYDSYTIVDSLSIFPVIAKAFMHLSILLDTVSVEDLADKERKNLLSIMLIAIINDLEKWVQVIFIQKTTLDIHYLDASFASNVFQVENIFVESEEDEDDLEFF